MMFSPTFCSILLVAVLPLWAVDAQSPLKIPDSLPIVTDRLLKGKGKNNGSRCRTIQARTMLVNVNFDNLTPEQIVFFEDLVGSKSSTNVAARMTRMAQRQDRWWWRI
jgi:hypothetical protein